MGGKIVSPRIKVTNATDFMISQLLKTGALTNPTVMNEAILTAAEVAEYYRISLSTLKRWVMLSRRGFLDLPSPIGAKGSQLRWRREDIETWNSRIGNEVPTSEQPPETPAERRRRDEKVSRGLKEFGVNFTSEGRK